MARPKAEAVKTFPKTAAIPGKGAVGSVGSLKTGTHPGAGGYPTSSTSGSKSSKN
jgi:hypothetical protein